MHIKENWETESPATCCYINPPHTPSVSCLLSLFLSWEINVQLVVWGYALVILQPCFCSSAPLKATEGFVWEGNARRLDFDCSRELCSPDVPFDQVTPPILTGRQVTQPWSTVAELQAYLWTMRRDHRHQMLCVTCLPALHLCQLGFLSLPYTTRRSPWALSFALAAGGRVCPV